MRKVLSGITALLVLLICCGVQAQGAPTYQETMSVVRYIVEARVMDAAGHAIKGLAPSDFEVTLAGRTAEVESVIWIGKEGGMGVSPSVEEETAEVRVPARLVVIFVSVDFARNESRIRGQMQFNENFLDPIFETLGAREGVAVLSFDSRLKVHCDFTTDREKAKAAVLRTIEIDDVPMPAPAESGPSLVRQLDPAEVERAANAEKAMLLIARALRQVEGPKLLIMPSWGMGERSDLRNGSVRFSKAWSEAVATLRRDHVPVVSVLTGLGGQLALGIAQTSHATGGVFTSAVSGFGEQSLRRIEGFLEGFYELTLRLPQPLEVGEYEVGIRAREHSLIVRSAPTVIVAPSDVLYGEAVSLFNSGEMEAALAVLRESIASESVSTFVIVERLRALVQAGQWEGALIIVEELERLNSVDGQVAEMGRQAREGLRQGREAEAMQRLIEARRRLLSGETEGVEQLLDEAIALRPELADAWHERGMLCLSEGRPDAAAGDLQRFLELESRGSRASEVRTILETIRR